MKLHHILACSTFALCALSIPTGAMASIQTDTGIGVLEIITDKKIATEDGSFELSRRGRGGDDKGRDDRGGDRRRGKGADDNGGDNNRGGRGGRRMRIPGGSGCDDAGDILEHAACRG
ncbi:MAG: hypothetical protein R3E44_01145 [Paracoccaceae bacterium]